MPKITVEENFKRIDAFCAQVLDLSRNECVRLIEDGSILLNGKKVQKKQAFRLAKEEKCTAKMLMEIVKEDIQEAISDYEKIINTSVENDSSKRKFTSF